MRKSYFFPRDEADARRSLDALKAHFGDDAVRRSRIRDGSRWNKAEACGPAAVHDGAKAFSYLGLLDVRFEPPS